MNIRAMVLSLTILPATASATYAFQAASPDSTARGASTSAQAAQPHLGAVLMLKTMVGGHIKVITGEAEHKGQLVAVTANAIDMGEETEVAIVPMTIPFENVESVWQRKRNTLLGLAIGVVSGAVVGVAVAPEGDWLFSDEERAMSGIAGALIGAGLGAIVGSQVKSYSLIYERP